MRFEIAREALLRPLQAVIGVVERRQTLPVLANVLVVADSSGISITATDLEVELVAHVQSPISEPGQVTLPARKLMDIVRNLPEDADIQISVEQDKALVSAQRSRFTLATLPAADFPAVEDIGDSQPLLLPQSQLRHLIEKTHFSMALQDVRYYLNGLLLELEPNQVRAVATDGHRLALCELGAEVEVSEAKQVIVPRKGVQELLRLLENSDDEVRLELGANHVRVALPELRFTSKLIDGRFPDYQRVIPQNAQSVLRVARDELRQALVRASILSNEKYRGVRLAVDGERLTLQSNNPEQEQAEEELAVQYQGDAMEVGFNASYMLDALQAAEGEEVELLLTDANSSCLLRGGGAQDSKYVIMPMRL
ncbi:DNA polymerase III subunit beta [Alkalilimnicola sp. S0819]|uniref:DNA polymerase III subunit beta n=1 Tax=Alkalilimnicola sp. S0819 TaxID=2613922 RepID=UPI001261C797|nr:DNA polymerase III subunit beta [Alkalilimnicola sp. S0819]KAB7624232.1 DNA polymerase III subunit beta [Alkalilimnicola sp. S0819]MPQ16487.1 DNA polymerase III subunit beta [Alkalilimnicola sp. S0819]